MEMIYIKVRATPTIHFLSHLCSLVRIKTVRLHFCPNVCHESSVNSQLHEYQFSKVSMHCGHAVYMQTPWCNAFKYHHKKGSHVAYRLVIGTMMSKTGVMI